jgi:hypothetical protein
LPRNPGDIIDVWQDRRFVGAVYSARCIRVISKYLGQTASALNNTGPPWSVVKFDNVL